MKKVFVFILLLLFVAFGSFMFFEYVDKDNNDIKESVKDKIIIKKVDYEEVKNSIFKKNYNKAYDLMKDMSIEEKIGQLFIVRYDNEMTSTFSNYNPGGYVLFAKDFENKTKDSLKNELSSISSKIPLAFAVDEEGGLVTRVSKYPNFRSERFASPRYYYEQGGYDLLKSIEKEKAELNDDSYSF